MTRRSVSAIPPGFSRAAGSAHTMVEAGIVTSAARRSSGSDGFARPSKREASAETRVIQKDGGEHAVGHCCGARSIHRSGIRHDPNRDPRAMRQGPITSSYGCGYRNVYAASPAFVQIAARAMERALANRCWRSSGVVHSTGWHFRASNDFAASTSTSGISENQDAHVPSVCHRMGSLMRRVGGALS